MLYEAGIRSVLAHGCYARYDDAPDPITDSLPFEELLRHTFDSSVSLLGVMVRNRAFSSRHASYVDCDTAEMLKLL